MTRIEEAVELPAEAAAALAADEAAERTTREICDRHEPRNFALLVAYQIVLRTGWIFKTESVIMPAFLDMITGGQAGWLRGCLPVLNRFGQSVPPMLAARRLKVTPLKKRALMTSTTCMGLVFLVLSALWFTTPAASGTWWMPMVFLLLYACFFITNGLNHLSLGTLQGKLIQPTHRGRLLSAATALGAITAVAAAYLLMTRWLALPDGGFGYLFGFTGTAFVLAALVLSAVKEPADRYHEPAVGARRQLAGAWRLLCEDRDLRRLAVVAALFSQSLILFPHYQALGLTKLGLPLEELMLWVVVQNVGTGIFSQFAGPLADARGTRLALRLLIFATATPPLLAAFLAHVDSQAAQSLYFLVFLPIGLTPLTIKTMQNYTLEISPTSEHPRYLSTMNICMAAPFVLSPLVGLLVDVTSFEAVFLTVAAIVVCGGLLTFRLVEPRHRPREEATTDVLPNE